VHATTPFSACALAQARPTMSCIHLVTRIKTLKNVKHVGVTTNKVPFLMNRQILDARLTKVQEYKIYVCIH